MCFETIGCKARMHTWCPDERTPGVLEDFSWCRRASRSNCIWVPVSGGRPYESVDFAASWKPSRIYRRGFPVSFLKFIIKSIFKKFVLQFLRIQRILSDYFTRKVFISWAPIENLFSLTVIIVDVIVEPRVAVEAFRTVRAFVLSFTVVYVA